MGDEKMKVSPITQESLGLKSISWLHEFVETMDWNGLPPRKLWRFLLRKLDERLGYMDMDYDY